MRPDASALGAVQCRDAIDVRKLSSLVCAGQVIETVSGRRYRVIAKISEPGRISFNLGTPAGNFHVTASELADLDPLPNRIARLAHVLRFFAYNKDFTQYINEAIKSHGLPTDSKMDWSKWLYSQFTTQGQYSEDQLDEALHEYIIALIYEKDILSKFNPKKVTEKTNRNKGEAGKVTAYLTRMFITYRSMVVRSLNRSQATVPGKKYPSGIRQRLDTPMMRPGVNGEEYNLLDAPAHATEPVQEEGESWEDIARFRAAYGEWLQQAEEPKTTDHILKLLDLFLTVEQRAGGDPSYYMGEWMKTTGKSKSYFQTIATELSETLQQFVEAYPELAETSLIARLIGDIKSKKQTFKSKNERSRLVPVAASLHLVAIAPSDLAAIPGDTGRIPHDNTGGTGDAAVILLDEKEPEQPQRTVAPEIPVIQHGF